MTHKTLIMAAGEEFIMEGYAFDYRADVYLLDGTFIATVTPDEIVWEVDFADIVEAEGLHELEEDLYTAAMEVIPEF